MAYMIVYLFLCLAIVSCSNENTKEFTFRKFSSEMKTNELITLPGFRSKNSYTEGGTGEKLLYFDNKNTDGYTLLIEKNHLDHTYAMKITYNIPDDISTYEAESDVVRKYKIMGKPIEYKEKLYDMITSMRSKSIVFGCADCEPNVDVDCYDWYRNLDRRMQLCASILEQTYSSGILRWINLYWYDFTEYEKLEEFRRTERDRIRDKMKF